MIRAEQLSRSFASRRAVHQLNFELKSGSVVAFVGPICLARSDSFL